MRVVNTDNFGRDYPNESFVSESLSEQDAESLADKLNEGGEFSSRYYKVVPDDYELAPGFEP